VVLGFSGAGVCSAGDVREFVLPGMSFSETLERARIQEIVPVEVGTSEFVREADTEFIIVGQVDGSSQTCRILNNQMACVFSDAQVSREGEQNGFLLARKIYLDRMLDEWTRTGDVREACPSATKKVCTAGVWYECEHEIVPKTHKESRPCTNEDITSGKCPSNGMVWVTVTINECHVSCSATTDSCTQNGGFGSI
jgi:hypothetical protein